MTTTLGAVAEIRVLNPGRLDIPVLHKIPNEAVKQRLRAWRAYETLRWGLVNKGDSPLC